MPRPTWSGAISFGLVNVPVKAYGAVHEHTVHFNQLEKRSGARIKYEKVSAKTGKPVAPDDIERGFEVAKGKYVVVEPEEFDDLRPESTRRIEISDFVELADVDPIYYANTYWLTPDRGGEDAYRLLLGAMEEAGRVGIGSVVMRNKQYLAAIRPLDGALAMSTMRFADEVVPRTEIEGLSRAKKKSSDSKQLRLARQIVDSLTSDWDPARYHDDYTEQMRELIRRKAKGEEIVAEPAEKTAKVLDLMAALEASVQERRSGRAKPPKTARKTTKAPPRPAAKRPTKRRSA